MQAMKRQALHAAEIGFVHPVTHQDMLFSSPLPDDIEAICAFFRKYTLK